MARSSETKSILLRLDAELADQLEAVAGVEGRSVSAIAREIRCRASARAALGDAGRPAIKVWSRPKTLSLASALLMGAIMFIGGSPSNLYA